MQRLANVTRLIREYYFGEVKLEAFPKEIEKRMGVSLFTAQEITRYIKSEIIDWDPVVEYLGQLPKIALREIIKNYPDIARQKITDRELGLKEGLDWDDPTIENWIHDYTQHLGQGQHSAIDRMNYLFHSENTGRLTSPEREKLGIILKSFDENLPLPVDKENKEIPLDYLIPEQSQNTKHVTYNTNSQPQVQKNQAQPVAPKPYIPPMRPIPVTQTSQPTQAKLETPEQAFIKPYPQTSEASPQTKKVTALAAPPRNTGDPVHLDFSNPFPQPGTHAAPKPIFNLNTKFSEPEPSDNILPVGNSYPLSHIPESDAASPEIRTGVPSPMAKPKLPNLEEPPRRASVINYFQTPEKFGNSPVEIKGFTEHQVPKNAPPNHPEPDTHENNYPATAPTSAEPRRNAPPYVFTPPPRNIIRPLMTIRGQQEKPEPKLDGNVVDLSGI
ncbi:MAG: hypothetical protein WC858_05020 [Parcubacteria group bacterium]